MDAITSPGKSENGSLGTWLTHVRSTDEKMLQFRVCPQHLSDAQPALRMTETLITSPYILFCHTHQCSGRINRRLQARPRHVFQRIVVELQRREPVGAALLILQETR